MHHDLNPEELKILGIYASSIVINADIKTQLGSIILLTYHTGLTNTLHYAICNSRRRVR